MDAGIFGTPSTIKLSAGVMTASCAGARRVTSRSAVNVRISLFFIVVHHSHNKFAALSYTANDWTRKPNCKSLAAKAHVKIPLHHKPAMFRKILIANRGEIAVRILRACRELGIRSAVVFSEVDRKSLHVRLAEEAYPIGPAPSRESYLCIDKLMDAARRAGCDAVHPGYGFLAENAALPRACADNGLTFIGPPAEAMESLGSKTAGRQLARGVDVPTVPGTNEPIDRPSEAQALANRMGYPVLLKAVAGGGGKGMRVVHGDAEFDSAFRDASSEAMNAFGDDRLYLEKYLDRPHHVEIQIFADAHGRVVSLGERECSVQRRHQKVIEEAPSPLITPDLRKKMGDAAVRLARAGGYVNAGTVEFLVDANLNFYFLEVNTRLQVEHPVTEQVTGLDLVKLQIAIAAGHRLPFAWESIIPRGHAMEVRIYAEDPDNNFFPSPGKIVSRQIPGGPGIRVDDGVYEGWTVPSDYDPLLSKLIAWGNSREETIARLRRALEEYTVTGIKTNVGLFRRILGEPDFLHGEIHTRWLDELLSPSRPAQSSANENRPASSVSDAAAIAAAIWQANQGDRHSSQSPSSPDQASRWKLESRRDQLDRMP
jgi:acetyl-CoA carboxylase biotin carboxylase subunit